MVRVTAHAAVAGAGIGGLAAAAALHRTGWDVAVLERAPVLAEVGAGIGLWPNALRALRAIDPGLVQELRPRSALQGDAFLHSANGRHLARFDLSWFEQRYGSPVLLVARPALHALLAERVPAAAVHLGCTVRDARTEGSRAVVTADGPAGRFEIETDLVVAADGVHSSLRALVDPRAAARYAGHTAWRALVPPALAPPVPTSAIRGARVGASGMRGWATGVSAGPGSTSLTTHRWPRTSTSAFTVGVTVCMR